MNSERIALLTEYYLAILETGIYTDYLEICRQVSGVIARINDLAGDKTPAARLEKCRLSELRRRLWAAGGESITCRLGLAVSKTWFSLDQLRHWRPRHKPSDYDFQHGSDLLDHQSYLRTRNSPYSPAAIITHLYRDEQQIREAAEKERLAVFILPESSYYPGNAVGAVLLPKGGAE